ncbi:MAG: hypothetical protein IPP29_19280 [Bacteroidetes bacterium]|nr:hypothetical protein [Bacteroidota bacterium]
MKWETSDYQYCCPIAGKYKDVAFDSNGNTFVLFEKFLDGGSNGAFLGIAFNKIDSMGYVIENEIYVIDSSTALQGGLCYRQFHSSG